jgi:3-hydroxybutyryl-CoA dehydratase
VTAMQTRAIDERASPVAVGECCEERVTFDAESIRAFAAMSGDWNPLHHDDAAAARSRFGRIIASGPHVVARMMGLEATYFSARHDALGLDNAFRFVRGVPEGTTLTLAWTVTNMTYKASLHGHIVAIEGRAIDDEGVVYVTGRGTILLRCFGEEPR